MKRFWIYIALIASAAALTACGSGGSSSSSSDVADNSNNTAPPPTSGRVYKMEPGTDVTTKALRAFIEARPGDTIQFACGYYDIKQTLLISHTEDVTITGCGKNKTVLSFANSEGNPVGILVDNARGIRVKNLTVADTDGDAFEMRSVDHGTLDSVRAFWSSGGGRTSSDRIKASNYQDGRLDVACTDPATRDPSAPENGLLGDTTSPDYTVSDKSGRYGIYPVKSKNILVKNSESIGASDAGIYVGQTNNTIIENSRAAYNVFGFEIENVRHGEYRDNLSECNTGGFLVYDLDNLTRYGQLTVMHDNISRMNNTYNFSSGGFVSNVPPGSGMVTLAYDGIDVYNNQFIDNNTAGIIHASYQVFPKGAGRPTDKKLDFYTEGLHIFNNTFKNNGNGIPLPTTTDLQNGDITHILPLAVGLKTALACVLGLNTKCPNDGKLIRGAHIVWDGYLPSYNKDCPYPKDADGNPIPKETGRYGEEGKPRFSGTDPQPDCHYNAYKFNIDQNGKAQRKEPLFYASCIDKNNTFSSDSVKFSNFHGTDGLDAAITLLGDDPVGDLLNLATLQKILGNLPNLPATFDIAKHRCEARFGKNLPRIEEVTIPPFQRSGEYKPAPSPEQVKELCEADTGGQVNFDALAAVDCPQLSQYHLFADASDPASTPNGPRSMPYVLNTKLFSDYSVKYRVIYLPPGKTMTYNAPGMTQAVGALIFPEGAVIAKTFSFDKNGTVTPIETRLLIKRTGGNGDARWVGLPYVWQFDDQGKPTIAEYTPEGKIGIHAEWNYNDINTGNPLSGQTDNYSVPTANQCLSCHANKDRPAGTAPIGPKVRNMNRPYESEVAGDTSGQARDPAAGQNQIAYLCSKGWMTNCPSDMGVDQNTQIATNLPRLPKYKVPGDSGFPANSKKDIEARTRAWLEVNCEHCHNSQGFADNTGLFLDTFRPVDNHYGICKEPAAAGSKGSGGRMVDIFPGNAGKSIITYRIGPDGNDIPAARMPPIARSVVDTQAYDLVTKWINTVVDDNYDNASGCTGG